MLTGKLGMIDMSDWDRERLEVFGTKLYFALVNNHNAKDDRKKVLQALSAAPNLQALRELVRYLYKTLLAAEENRASRLPPLEIQLTW
jgi:hypothetical protein